MKPPRSKSPLRQGRFGLRHMLLPSAVGDDSLRGILAKRSKKSRPGRRGFKIRITIIGDVGFGALFLSPDPFD